MNRQITVATRTVALPLVLVCLFAAACGTRKAPVAEAVPPKPAAAAPATPTPDGAAVQAIAAEWRDVRVLMVLGTWSKDSKRDVPRFFKIFDQVGLKLDKVTTLENDIAGILAK
jgi:hypothetical protein